ncbi:protein kinase, partial [bacterium]|nr:protein kinase [bacterium]
IHRDVKPANCLMDKAGRLKLADFGLAKILDSDTNLTSTGVSMGSPNYMSPEMAKGEKADHRADMYAVGLTLYQMLTGKLAFSGPTATAVLLKQVNEDLPITSELVAKAGLELVAIIKRMCAKYPDERFDTYEELIKLLKHIRATAKDTPAGMVMAESRTVQLESVSDNRRPSLDAPATWAGAAISPTVPSRQSVEQLPVPEAPDRSRSKLPMVAVAAALILAAVGLGLYALSGPSGDESKAGHPPVPATPSPSATTGTLGGEVTVTGIDASELAGTKILLFAGVDKEQYRLSAERIAGLRKEVVAMQAELNQALSAITGEVELRRTLQAQLAEQSSQSKELSTVKATGDAYYTEVARLKQSIANLETNLASFNKTGFAKLVCEHPVTQQQFILTVTNNKKAESVALAERALSEGRAELQKREAEMKRLEVDYASKNDSLQTLNGKVEALQGELRSLSTGAQAQLFRTRFPELVRKQAELMAEEARLAEIAPSQPPAGEAVIDGSGRFVFRDIRPGDYLLLLKAAATGQGATARDLTWIIEQPVKVGSEVSVPMSGANAIVNRRQEATPLLARMPDSDYIDRAITMAVASGEQRDTALPQVVWTTAILTD